MTFEPTRAFCFPGLENLPVFLVGGRPAEPPGGHGTQGIAQRRPEKQAGRSLPLTAMAPSSTSELPGSRVAEVSTQKQPPSPIPVKSIIRAGRLRRTCAATACRAHGLLDGLMGQRPSASVYSPETVIFTSPGEAASASGSAAFDRDGPACRQPRHRARPPRRPICWAVMGGTVTRRPPGLTQASAALPLSPPPDPAPDRTDHR